MLLNFKTISPDGANKEGSVVFARSDTYAIPNQFKSLFPGTYSPAVLGHIKYVCENMDALKEKYYEYTQKTLGKKNIVSLDMARDLLPGYNGRNGIEYNVPARGLVESIFDDLLLQAAANKRKRVLFTAGGPGSGKTGSLDAVQKNGHRLKPHAIAYDSTLTEFDTAKSKIEKALHHKYKVEVYWVYRDPFQAFKNGVIPRAEREGRIVKIKIHVEKHRAILKNMIQLKRYFKNRINFTFIDNTGAKDDAKAVPLDQLKWRRYTTKQLTDLCKQEAEIAYNQGILSRAQYLAMIEE
jgi:hypothetical protein